MKIFVNGDSHTSGSELYFPTQDGYAYRLANLLGGEIIENPAMGGASNDRILRTTEAFLEKCEQINEYPDLIVIGWSEVWRQDWFVGGVYETPYSDLITPETAKKIDYERAEHENDTWRWPINGNVMTKYFHSRMYNLHQHLNYLNIPHLFFMAVHSINDTINDNRIRQDHNSNFIKFNWDDCFWNVYHDIDGSFLNWGRNRDYYITPYHHLKEDAHEAFAKVLYDYIKDKSLLAS